MKYIVFEDGQVVLFSRSLVHKEVAAKLGLRPVSAEFVRTMGEEYRFITNGESVSLRLKAGLDDGAKIDRAFDA